MVQITGLENHRSGRQAVVSEQSFARLPFYDPFYFVCHFSSALVIRFLKYVLCALQGQPTHMEV